MQLSDKLDEALAAFATCLERGDLAEKSQEILTQGQAGLTAIRDEILNLQGFVPLPLDEQEQQDFRDLSLDELKEQSVLLGAIHRAGINVKSNQWFTKAERQLARRIAENYREFSKLLKAFRTPRKKEDAENEWSFLIHDGTGLPDFLKTLDKHNVISKIKVLVKSEKKPKFSPFKWREWTPQEGQSFLVIFAKNDPALNHLLYGDWLTAFVADVIEDHLERNQIVHEVFTKITYSAPVDVLKSKSDFDVISFFDDTAFCFECKSGVITKAIAEEVAQKAQEISSVLNRFVPSIEEFIFFVVYDDQLNPDEKMQSFFEGTDIEPKRVDQVRERIFLEVQ